MAMAEEKLVVELVLFGEIIATDSRKAMKESTEGCVIAHRDSNSKTALKKSPRRLSQR